ncbi:UvrD-helicase domain-containing protein [Sandarakinorhabdus sp.]|uniref:ATP-dependent helicase n=1 Tax=Sandarakinorhabdus sp. TaxID=1916663 RepID=UPI00333EF020
MQPAPPFDSAPASQPPWLAGLNAPQREAVTTTEGPLLILAGAGTGKTKALTARLAHILWGRLAFPSQVLAVTFTNKAAREMRHRTEMLLGPMAEGLPWLGTFHALSAKMLRRQAALVGLTPDFTILDTDDQLRLLKQVLAEADIDDKRWPAKQLASLIDRWKNKGFSPDLVPAGERHGFADGKAPALYARYQQRLAGLNACDFGDLLLHMISIFRSHPDVLADWQRRFRYIMVDEYQDTNSAQHQWLTALIGPHRNIACVGDDDQSIYSWRGAEVSNILQFERDFPGARMIRLEENYRSTPHILGAANALIAHNSGRLGKALFTAHADGHKVQVTSVWDGPEEARLVGDEAERLARGGASLNEVAILVRAQFQTRLFEDRFIAIGMPYRIVGGFRFYERAEVRDALAYLRLVAQPDDALAFERIINVPKRGLGDKAMATMHAAARRLDVSLPRAAAALAEGDGLTPAARRTVKAFLANISRWRDQAGTVGHAELAEIILEESGYVGMWQAEKSTDADGRIDNLKELVRAMGDYPTLTAFLEHVALVMDNEAAPDDEKITIMTLHAAKGLEFDQVFLPGWEEGVFPSQRAMDEGGTAALEEERRLAYVGITRARKAAHIINAANRQVYGQWTAALPSRFIAELPDAHVEARSTLSGGPSLWRAALAGGDPFADVERGTGRGPGWTRAITQPGHEAGNWAGDRNGGRDFGPLGSQPAREQSWREARVSAVSLAAAPTIRRGAKVFHAKFGEGVVFHVDGNKLEIDFPAAGRKRVLDSFVTLRD